MFHIEDRDACIQMVLTAVKRSMHKASSVRSIDAHTLLKDELGMDSLGMMSLLLLIEKETRLRIGTAASAFGRCRHADEIVDLLCRLGKEQAKVQDQMQVSAP